jgi:adenylosuccinate lyase
VAFEAQDKGIQYSEAVKNDKAFSSKLTNKEIESIFSPEKHLGASPQIIKNVNIKVQKTVKKFI